MAYELSWKLLYSTSTSIILNRWTKYQRNKSFIYSRSWLKLLIRRRIDTTLSLNNATGHSFSIPHCLTRHTSHAVPGMYSEIYTFHYTTYIQIHFLYNVNIYTQLSNIYNYKIFTGQDLFRSYRSRQIFVYMHHTECCKQLDTSTWKSSFTTL